MNVTDLEISTATKIARLLRILESTYNTTIDFKNTSIVDLDKIHEECKLYTQMVLNESNIGSDPEYGKAMMVQEAIRLFLSEIAPKRIKRQKNAETHRGA